ncbi:unnamed protein product [Phytophthora fragariaefolia]|uniref:Unnamed protein product n=1 Tax=Phytophthora fragariaefolia TaxID=1490495 RepID=A0A9W6WZN7_9STRA|nr:unnamed protein product [Phytophthora fragariaefolia]
MINESSKTEGLPYGWDGKDWRRYKWTMRTIFREHDLLDFAEGKLKCEGLSSEESEANFDKKQFKVMRMIGTTVPSHRPQQIDQYETGTEINNDGGLRQAGGLSGGSSQPGRSNNGCRGNGGGGHGAKGTGARSSSRGGRAWSPRQEPGTVATALEEAHLATALDEAHLISSNTPGVRDNAGVATEIPSGSSWFCFDTGSNVHIVGDRHSFVHLEDIVLENLAADVKGVAHSMVTQAEGIGTVKIVSVEQDKEVELFIDGVLYVPGGTHGLLSMGLALEKGFEVDYDRATRVYSVHKDGEHVIEARPAQAIWAFETVPPSQRSSKPDGQQEGRAIVNYTVADGVGSLQVWHERLAHTCAQYLKVIVDRGLVNGMMLTQRQAKACDASPNEVVYADLLFPGQGNGTRYKAVLVIMDGWSRFLTVHLLTNKSAATVNALIQQYVVWAERQGGRGIKKIIQREFEPTESARFPVRHILTDKGGEFVNSAINGWYASRGIEHIRVGPKTSHLNPCERAHQSLMAMVKAHMHASGFPRSFWPYALKNAAYIKTRVYAKPVEGVPYEGMFGVKPDIHHIRKFGSLAYVHVPISPDKQKQDANAYVAFGLGYAEDTVGCQVFIPTERTSHNEDADAYSEINTSVSQEQSDLEPTMSIRIEGGEDAGEFDDAVEDAGDFDDEEADDSDAVLLDEERGENQNEKASGNNLPQMPTRAENDIESLGGECGSEHGSDNSANGSVVGEDEPEQGSERHDGFDQHEQALSEGLEQHEVVMLPGMRRRTGREDTPSEVQRNQLGEDVKARRTGLRVASQRRAPARYQDYMAWSKMAVRVMGKDGRPLRAQQVKSAEEPQGDVEIQACKPLLDGRAPRDGCNEVERSAGGN